MATKVQSKAESANRFAKHAEHLSLYPNAGAYDDAEETTAVGARFITPRDPVIELASGDRLPAIPLKEAEKLNDLKKEAEDSQPRTSDTFGGTREESSESTLRNAITPAKKLQDADEIAHEDFEEGNKPLRDSTPPSRTNPLFPPLPLYGPPTLLRTLQCYIFRFLSFWLSLAFLGCIVVGSAVTSLPLMFRHIAIQLTFRNPDARRPFHEEEKKRRKARKEAERAWVRDRRRKRKNSEAEGDDNEKEAGSAGKFLPTEGGKDRLLCDPAYYARRVGLDIEEYKVQTEDGFIITLWHVYNPLEYTPASADERAHGNADLFSPTAARARSERYCARRCGKRKYPVLMMHGLLQCAGAYCANDDDSLAFFLAKSGFDVWLGNNRCGLRPEHKLLRYGDPRMWAWNIRQMGVLDLAALVSRVLSETGFEKLGLVCHSQGTTQTFVALAKEQRPDLGARLSVFCALAPAVYAGPLIGRIYFRFMRLITPAMFRLIFGIHAFIPLMMTMHARLPGRLYGAMGYRVFAFLFAWTDDRWDRGLRDRLFQFAPVYVSAESMRWWLGRECFARHKCILATREEGRREAVEDEEEEARHLAEGRNPNPAVPEGTNAASIPTTTAVRDPADRGRLAWYDARAPPFALWIAGSDELVDGRRLLQRFAHGREPHVRVVHAKVIDEYEHLDVLWAMDVIEKVGLELREVLWRTAGEGREGCTVPVGCEGA